MEKMFFESQNNDMFIGHHSGSKMSDNHAENFRIPGASSLNLSCLSFSVAWQKILSSRVYIAFFLKKGGRAKK